MPQQHDTPGPATREALPATAGQIADALRLFVEPGQVTELRVIDYRDNPKSKYKDNFYGYFDHAHLHQMAAAALNFTHKAEAVYFIPNPLLPAVLARCPNIVEAAGKGDATSDSDVKRRHWMFVDADPVRPARVSSSDEEKAAAEAKIAEVRNYLTDRGFPDPLFMDSGNGYHLAYRIDLPCDDGGLVQRVLESLAKQFDDERVKIDRKVFNPARPIKLYGTLAAKGHERGAEVDPPRPHRWARVLEVPDE